MKRGKKLLLLLAVLVIAAGAALAAVRLFPDGEAMETAEEPETMILSLSSDELSLIGWTYEDETITFTKTDDGWEYAGDPAFPLSETSFGSVLSGVASVAATKTIEAPGDVSQYGLDEPACEVMVEPAEGDTVWLRIGSETDIGGERYVSIGDGNVYLTDASILDAFSVGLYDLVQNESIPYMAEVSSFEVDAETQTLVIEHLPDSGLVYSDRYEWFARSEDSYITLDTELTEDLIESVTLLSWSGCVDYAADGSELADYGLDTPAAAVTVHYITQTQMATNLTDDSGNVIYDTEETEESFVLELGAYVDSYCYARLAGSDMVYIVDASILDGLLYTNAVSLRPDEVIAVDWSIVDAIDIMLDEKTFSLKKGTVPADTEEEPDESTEDYGEVELTYETAWLLDGEAVPIEDALAELTELSVLAYADGESPERSEELHIVIHQQSDSYPELELSLYEYDSSATLAILNGETETYVARSEAASLIAALTEALTSASEADAEEALPDMEDMP